MKLRIKYKRATGSIGEFTHTLPKRINPNNSYEVDQFVNDFVKGMNIDNESLSWNYLGKVTEHKVKKPKVTQKIVKPSNYAVVSKKARIDPATKDERVRQRKIKQYYQKKEERRKLQLHEGEFLIIETPSQEVSTGVYKYMKKHRISHTKTSKRCQWYKQGIRQEYRTEDADPSDVTYAIYYLQGFDPQVLTFDKEYRR